MERVSHANSVEFGKAICNALGIDSDKVASLVIYASPRELVTVSVEMYLPELSTEQMAAIVDALRKDGKEVKAAFIGQTYRVANVPLADEVAI